MLKYGSLKSQMVIITSLVVKYAEYYFQYDLSVNVPSRVSFLVEIFVILCELRLKQGRHDF